jgi:translation initiation factor IF-3
MDLEEAMRLATDRKLDLVNIAPSANPPVCKIMDYGKYRYELQKKEKEARKKQKITQVKEIRLSTFIEEHDLKVKANNAIKFLKEGDKVKVSLRFRGRERDYVHVGQKAMGHFAEIVSDFGSVEKAPSVEGRSMVMVLAPKNDSKQ